jgi:hypothetical protein
MKGGIRNRYEKMPIHRSRGDLRLFQLLSLFGLIFVIFASPESFGFSVCPIYNVTGYPCPGCGITRSTFRFFHFHFEESMRWHPFGPAVVFGMLIFAISSTSNRVYELLLKFRRGSVNLITTLAILTTIYGVVRIIFIVFFPGHYEDYFNEFREPALFRDLLKSVSDFFLGG